MTTLQNTSRMPNRYSGVLSRLIFCHGVPRLHVSPSPVGRCVRQFTADRMVKRIHERKDRAAIGDGVFP